MKTTIFIVDDHAIVRDGLKAALAFQTDFQVIGEAEEGVEAVKKIQKLKPNIVLMDIAIPGINGIQVTRQLRDKGVTSRVLILSMFCTAEHVWQAFNAGAQGYVLKGSNSLELIKAIRAVLNNTIYLDSKMPTLVVNAFLEMTEGNIQKNPLARLTPREREVLQRVIDGKSSNEISIEMALSVSTVDTYRSRLMQKLGVGNMTELVKFAIQNHLVPLNY